MPFTLALTGGPCGGKSTSLSALKRALEDKGLDVYTCPEVPTIMISGGCVYPGEAAGRRLIEFETALIRLQLQMENSFQQVAQSTGKPSVIIVDRGLIDISAYIPGIC
jgi:predicted ATPase